MKNKKRKAKRWPGDRRAERVVERSKHPAEPPSFDVLAARLRDKFNKRSRKGEKR